MCHDWFAGSGRHSSRVSLGKEERLDDIACKLCSFLPSILRRESVVLAYLYGSATTGLTTPSSDVDIALVVEPGLSALEQLKLTLRLQADLSDHLAVPNADVRIINDASLVFRGRVVCDGLLLYARDERARIEFETTTRTEYFDYLPIHRRLQDAFFADLRERGFDG